MSYLNILPQVLIDGLTLGFVYAVVAIGYTLVYGVLEFINFAHSEIFMFGAFVGGETLLLMNKTGLLQAHPLLSLFLGMLLGALLSGILGVIVDRIAYKPLRASPRLVPLISAIGVSFVLQDLVRMTEGVWHNTFYLTYPPMLTGNVTLLHVAVPFRSLIVVVSVLIMMLALFLFVSKTRLGKGLRAVAQDPSTASLMGINVNGIIGLTFLIGPGLGGAAGVLFGLQYSLINPYVGFILGMKAFTAAVFGGIGNIPGAMLGGVLLGLFESLASAYLGVATHQVFGAQYKDVFAFVLLILILIFKPSGLLGERVREKV